MKPVLIFRHVICEGPGFLADFLETRNIPFQIIRIDEGEKVPETTDSASGLVFMGGPMSVNDSLPWIKQELELIREAHTKQLPVLGHCLGGQLISKALGGEVVRNEVTEIGWYPLQPAVTEHAPSWVQDLSYDTEIFHWHGETFTLPEGAVPLFENKHCKNQGFIMNNTIALQCHVEMQAGDIQEWLSFYQDEIPSPDQSVQSPDEMLSDTDNRISRLHEFADIIYSQWLNGFKYRK